MVFSFYYQKVDILNIAQISILIML
jgi:hypothetical protein